MKCVCVGGGGGRVRIAFKIWRIHVCTRLTFSPLFMKFGEGGGGGGAATATPGILNVVISFLNETILMTL